MLILETTLLRVVFIIIHNSTVLNIFKMLWKHMVIISHQNVPHALQYLLLTCRWERSVKRLVAISLKEHTRVCDFRKIKIATLASRAGFLKQHDYFRSRMIFVVECGCLVHPRMFSRVPTFYSLDASSTSLPAMTTRNVPKYFQMSPEVQNCPIENHWPREV